MTKSGPSGSSSGEASVACIVLWVVSTLIAGGTGCRSWYSKAVLVDLKTAQGLITRHLQEVKPMLAPGVEFPVRETTTEEVWQKLQVQVYQVTGEVSLNQSFVIRGEQVIPIGESFGGDGVTSMCAADVDSDGRNDLVYSYVWGSGFTRINIAWLDLAAIPPHENVLPEECFQSVDLRVSRRESGAVQVTIDGADSGRIVGRDSNGFYEAHLELVKDKRHLLEQSGGG
jgi:hypothetical protein